MIRIKFENLEQAKKSISIVNEYEKFDKLLKAINALVFIIIMIMICLNCPMIIELIIFFIIVILNLLNVTGRLVDLVYECPCEVKAFRKNCKEVLKNKELMKTYDEIKYMESNFPYAIVNTVKNVIEIIESEDRAAVVVIKGKWKFNKVTGTIYNIDLDNREVY